MAKREVGFSVKSAAGQFPVIVETSFRSTPKEGSRKGLATDYKISVTYADWHQLIHRAIRATVIDCGNAASEGTFPFRDGEVISVDYRGETKRTVDDDIHELRSKTADEQAAALKELEARLQKMKEAFAQDNPTEVPTKQELPPNHPANRPHKR